LFWINKLSRPNGHSNAGVYNFDFDAHDPINDFGEALVEQGILTAEDIVRRNGNEEGRDYYVRHALGRIGQEADDYVVETMRIAQSEPEPDPAHLETFIRDPYPEVVEAPLEGRKTNISLNGAIRAAMRDILEANPMTWI